MFIYRKHINRIEFANTTSVLGKSYRRKQVLTIYMKSVVGLQSSLSCSAMMNKGKIYAKYKVIRKEIDHTDCVTVFCNPVTLLNFLKTLALELNYEIKTLIYLKKDLVGFVQEKSSDIINQITVLDKNTQGQCFLKSHFLNLKINMSRLGKSSLIWSFV